MWHLQLQHMAGGLARQSISGTGNQDSTLAVLLHFSKAHSLAEGLKGQLFSKPNKEFLMCRLLQKIWEKAKPLQKVTGHTGYSPTWDNYSYTELAKLQHGTRWCVYGVTHIKHIIIDGHLLPFAQLQARYGLPSAMLFFFFTIYN